MKAALFALFAATLAGCAESYLIVQPARETVTVTRVIASSDEIEQLCRYVTGCAGRTGCALWTGSRGVLFLPDRLPAELSGHEHEHLYSGAFHVGSTCRVMTE